VKLRRLRRRAFSLCVFPLCGLVVPHTSIDQIIGALKRADAMNIHPHHGQCCVRCSKGGQGNKFGAAVFMEILLWEHGTKRYQYIIFKNKINFLIDQNIKSLKIK
jgi:hypothetical protein